jgi:signal transduction histidine kinase
MARFFKRKSASAKNPLGRLKKAYEELDRTARALIRTDLQLHRTNERFDQQISQLTALHRVGELVNSTFDLEVILSAASGAMVKDLDFEKSGIIFLEKRGEKPMQSAYSGFTSREYRYFLDHFDSLIGAAVQSEEVYLQTAAFAPEEWRPLLKALGLESLLLVPIRVKSRLIGLLVGGRTHLTMRLTEPERRFYCMYAAQVASAIENARLYEALGQFNLSLEDKVQERTRNLMEANERLRELDTIKSNFISLVSHELRTPLTAIKGFVGTLLHYGKEISEEKRRFYLSVLNEETDRLTRLITDLLDVSRIESGRTEMKWQAVRLPELVRRVFQAFSIKAGSVKLLQEFPADFPEIYADSSKIEQVIMNLVGNGLRYCPPDGMLRISGRRHRDGVILEVHDNGPGIPFSQLEKIFDGFYRIDNEINKKNPGAGLGLSICRALVNLHGGKIWAESEPDQGARFLLTLPLNLDKQRQTASPPSGDRALGDRA